MYYIRVESIFPLIEKNRKTEVTKVIIKIVIINHNKKSCVEFQGYGI